MVESQPQDTPGNDVFNANSFIEKITQQATEATVPFHQLKQDLLIMREEISKRTLEILEKRNDLVRAMETF